VTGVLAMRRLITTGRLVVVISVTLAFYDSVLSTSGADDHHDYSDDVINAARCRVRCLSLLQVFIFITAFLAYICKNISRLR